MRHENIRHELRRRSYSNGRQRCSYFNQFQKLNIKSEKIADDYSVPFIDSIRDQWHLPTMCHTKPVLHNRNTDMRSL